MTTAVTLDVEVTPVLDTSQYADGDHMSDVFTIDVKNDRATLLNVEVQDLSDQGEDFDIVLFSTSPTVASSKNSALNISDANAAYARGPISISTWVDMINSQLGYARNVGLGLTTDQSAGNKGKLYGLLVSRGTGTYAADGINLRFYFAVDS